MDSPQQKDHQFLSYIGVAFEFIAVLGFLGFVGYLVDIYQLSGQPGWGLIVGIGVGFFYGIYHLYRRAINMMANTPPASKAPPPRTIDELQADWNDLDRRIDEATRRIQK